MITTTEIKKQFGSIEVLKGINLKIDEGNVVSIVGASGAGKTTLLQIIGTLLKQDQGSILIDGVDTSSLNASKLAQFRNKNIGFVFQFHHLLPEFTALENVCIPGMIAKTDSGKLNSKAKELLDMMGLSHRLQHKPMQLSGGEQQRVAVARALINAPKIILADEPSGNLDSKNKQELHQLFFTLRDTFKQTFLIVTHDKELASMSDRTVVMADGLIIQ